MIHSVFFISSGGEVLIEKHWRSITPRLICDYFWSNALKYDNKEEVPPFLYHPKYYLISIYRDGNFFLACAKSEVQPLLVIEFLHRVVDILEDYFEIVEESTIKENFAMIYQLLEEMMDFGYPLTTEPNALKSMIVPPTVISRISAVTTGVSSNVSDTLPEATVSNMPWRKTNVVYAQNEIYVDIIEEVDAIVSRSGVVISSEVNGTIVTNSKLSGVPDLTLNFVDPSLIDDCSFHPCVRYARFERDKVVSFVPPDGIFELMKYRFHRSSVIVAPCYCQPQFLFDYSANQGTVSIMVGPRTQHSLIYPPGRTPLEVEDVVLVIPFSKSVRTANLIATVGVVLYDEATKIAKWTIGKLQSSPSEKVPHLTGVVLLQPNSTFEESPHIELQWKVPLASISGLAVASLQLANEKYKPYKGVRTIAQAGKFIIRSDS